MGGCTFIRPGKGRCGSTAMGGSEWCYGHRPDLADERRRNASRGGKAGGRGRGSGELAEVQKRLRGLAEDVIAGRVDRGDAAVAGQLLGTYLRSVAVALKVKEVTDLEERIAALEAGIDAKGERWRA